MKILSVPFLVPATSGQGKLPVQPIDKLPVQPIDNEPWAQGTGLSCEAGFSIFHFNKGLCIQYSVVEPMVHVKKRKINEAVHKDNCVEFFIAFDNEKGYYN